MDKSKIENQEEELGKLYRENLILKSEKSELEEKIEDLELLKERLYERVTQLETDLFKLSDAIETVNSYRYKPIRIKTVDYGKLLPKTFSTEDKQMRIETLKDLV